MQDYIDDFVNKENGGGALVDALRYYLTQIAPETKDSEFTWKGFQDAANSELTDIFGNFVNRAMVLMHKLTHGKVPPLHTAALTEADKNMLAQLAKTKETVENLLEQYKFREAQFEVIDLARIGNRYLQGKEPWKKVKQTGENGQPTEAAQQDIDNTLHICLQTCANLAILINPFLPNTARKMLHMFKVVDKMLDWENAGKTKLLSVGYSLRAPELLFRKIEDEEISYQLEKLRNNSLAASVSPENKTDTTVTAPANNPQPPAFKPAIQFDDFAKIDLRTGTIVSAEKVEKADKLLKLSIDLGSEVRTIVSGIAQHFKPEDLSGQQVVVVANLAPRKMRGIESNGMILMASDEKGKLHFVRPQNKINPGAEIN
ncbi:MAG TPA: methionine--tRNA ligase subunit beta, partial [Flavihumibacter sp.]|nr:methionine--tRNA ligase subunit beta [Flavihumibacter sp.]